MFAQFWLRSRRFRVLTAPFLRRIVRRIGRVCAALASFAPISDAMTVSSLGDRRLVRPLSAPVRFGRAMLRTFR